MLLSRLYLKHQPQWCPTHGSLPLKCTVHGISTRSKGDLRTVGGTRVDATASGLSSEIERRAPCPFPATADLSNLICAVQASAIQCIRQLPKLITCALLLLRRLQGLQAPSPSTCTSTPATLAACASRVPSFSVVCTLAASPVDTPHRASPRPGTVEHSTNHHFATHQRAHCQFAQHALAYQGRRPLCLHPASRAPEVEGHQVADTLSPVGDVFNSLPRNFVVALGYNKGSAHTPLEHLRRPVPVFGHCRHLLPLCQRGARPVREDIRCYCALDWFITAHHTTVFATIAPDIDMAIPIQ